MYKYFSRELNRLSCIVFNYRCIEMVFFLRDVVIVLLYKLILMDMYAVNTPCVNNGDSGVKGMVSCCH